MALSDFLPSKEQIVNATTKKADNIVNSVLSAGESVLRDKLGPLGDLIFGPEETRLQSAGLNRGAEPDSITAFSPSAGAEADTRIRLFCPSGSKIKTLLASSPILSPLLYSYYGVVFPYQPNISVIHSSNYSMQHPTHTNFAYPIYENSAIQNIIIPGEFSASNLQEARYVLAAIHFFRTVTKMFYGQDTNAGTPPPVLRLKGGGRYMFDDVPVVVSDFNYVLPDDVDYIPVNVQDVPNTEVSLLGSNSITMVPTSCVINVTLMPVYSRQKISREFSVSEFARGNLFNNNGTGGFM